MRTTILIALAAAALAVAAATGTAAGPGHSHAKQASPLAKELARARVATAPFATSLEKAKAAGYTLQITPNMPGMGFHFLNPKITAFDAAKPPVLVYVKRGNAYQLAAFEWVWPEKPARAPLPGATYGSFAAACHYASGEFVPAAAEADCASTHRGAAFTFWHPDLVTMHVWLWYPNPDGIFAATNPLVTPFTPAA
jgi:hypothetical protein